MAITGDAAALLLRSPWPMPPLRFESGRMPRAALRACFLIAMRAAVMSGRARDRGSGWLRKQIPGGSVCGVHGDSRRRRACGPAVSRLPLPLFPSQPCWYWLQPFRIPAGVMGSGNQTSDDIIPSPGEYPREVIVSPQLQAAVFSHFADLTVCSAILCSSGHTVSCARPKHQGVQTGTKGQMGNSV